MAHMNFMDENFKVACVDIEQDGKIIIATQLYETTALRTISIAYNYIGIANINSDDFVANYVYIEKFCTGKMQRVLFEVKRREAYEFPIPKEIAREDICERQLEVLRLIHNNLLN